MNQSLTFKEARHPNFLQIIQQANYFDQDHVSYIKITCLLTNMTLEHVNICESRTRRDEKQCKN